MLLLLSVSHNFLLQHANNDSPYEDHTGAMGSAIYGFHDQTGFPLSCYNSYNHWLLGWYSERTITVNPASSQLITIAAFVDYHKTTSSQYVVASVDNQLFMQYNRAKDFNRDTYEFKDSLVIVRKLAGDEGTNLVAALDYSNPTYETSFTISGSTTVQNLIIEVCSSGIGSNDRPDYMTVSIGFDRSLCTQERRVRQLR
jgi:hypothetical protein